MNAQKIYRPKPRDEVKRNMAAIRSTGGKAEQALRSALHRSGLRFRKNAAGVLGRPDVVFPTERVAVFVDGDYWHGRLVRERGWEEMEQRIKVGYAEYWRGKFERNIARDDYVTSTLRENGWIVVRLWESDVRRDTDRAAALVRRAVFKRRSKRQGRTNQA